MADIWGFAKSTENLIWLIRRKPQISTTANVRSKFTLRERLQETPEPHSRNPLISPGLIEKLLSTLLKTPNFPTFYETITHAKKIFTFFITKTNPRATKKIYGCPIWMNDDPIDKCL